MAASKDDYWARWDRLRVAKSLQRLQKRKRKATEDDDDVDFVPDSEDEGPSSPPTTTAPTALRIENGTAAGTIAKSPSKRHRILPLFAIAPPEPHLLQSSPNELALKFPQHEVPMPTAKVCVGKGNPGNWEQKECDPSKTPKLKGAARSCPRGRRLNKGAGARAASSSANEKTPRLRGPVDLLGESDRPQPIAFLPAVSAVTAEKADGDKPRDLPCKTNQRREPPDDSLVIDLRTPTKEVCQRLQTTAEPNPLSGPSVEPRLPPPADRPSSRPAPHTKRNRTKAPSENNVMSQSSALLEPPALSRASTKDTPRTDPPPRLQKKQSVSKTGVTGMGAAMRGIFTGLRAFFLPKGLLQGRLKALKKQWSDRGGVLVDNFCEDVEYIVTEVSWPKLLKELGRNSLQETIHVVRADWVSQSIMAGKLAPILLYGVVDAPHSNGEALRNSESSASRVVSDAETESGRESEPEESERELGRSAPPALIVSSSSVQSIDAANGKSSPIDLDLVIQQVKNAGRASLEGESDTETDQEGSDAGDDADLQIIEDSSEIPKGKNVRNASRFLCMQKNGRVELDKANKNKALTDLLEVVLKRHEADGDQWRVLSYRKAIQILKRHPKKIESAEEAKKIYGIGGKLADKAIIGEIIQTGRLRKAEHTPEMMPVLELFQGIHGCGINIARKWYAQGFRTLDDLRQKAKLTHDQALGLKYYHDLQEKMPREEAGRIGGMVERACHALDPRFECVMMGSYRRGASMCGDVDVIVTHPDGVSHHKVLTPLVERLKADNLVVADLRQQKMSVDDDRPVYMGIVRLPGGTGKARRLDILVVPYDELGAALIHFTGNDVFNRSIRLLAGKKGWRLSQHGLFANVMRGKNRTKITEGHRIASRTEQEIFAALGVPWRAPEDRNC